jgi:hypothetical protein
MLSPEVVGLRKAYAVIFVTSIYAKGRSACIFGGARLERVFIFWLTFPIGVAIPV